MKPNKKNFCGGNFQDWLEVMLTEKCNVCCSWCIENEGFKPKFHADWITIAKLAIKSGEQNIILLGGEPTLYEHLMVLINYLASRGRKVYITTNGSKLTPKFVSVHMEHITGVNISIYDYSLFENALVTDISLTFKNLIATISRLRENGATVRLNCNLIKGHIDDEDEVYQYIEFAKDLGATSVRFAELKNDLDNFVDLHSIFGDRYGINNDPFTLGCNSDTVINDMPVNFRQMCGLQTPVRPMPQDPEQASKTVLYYDGQFYDGWQTEKESVMTERQILELLISVQGGDVSVVEAAQRIMSMNGQAANKPEAKLPPTPPEGQILRKPTKTPTTNNGGCRY